MKHVFLTEQDGLSVCAGVCDTHFLLVTLHQAYNMKKAKQDTVLFFRANNNLVNKLQGLGQSEDSGLKEPGACVRQAEMRGLKGLCKIGT